MAPVQNVALVGSNGAIAPSILTALQASPFKTTVLIRSTTNTSTLPPNTHTLTIEYTLSSLTTALRGIDVVISTLGATASSEQRLLLEASIAAKVTRFIPSSFGSDLQNPLTRALPVFKDKIEVEELLASKASSNEIEYSILYCGPFLDWGMKVQFFANVSGQGTIEIYDGGRGEFSSTTVAGVGKAIVAILTHFSETKNRILRVSEAVVSQRLLLDIADGIRGPEMKNTAEEIHVNSSDLEKFAYDNLHKGELGMDTWVAFIKRSLFGQGYGAKWDETDNRLLEVGVLSQEELESVVRGVIEG
ncbi:MAG: hypothetical protein M1812_000858 [Candelaria pacifica]|nr:MAG: hypothetical protein M1812_000858 [Candelaria pacifica]